MKALAVLVVAVAVTALLWWLLTRIGPVRRVQALAGLVAVVAFSLALGETE